MKSLILITFTLFTVSLNSNELSWVDTQIEAIKPSRKGMSNSDINKVKDPFTFYKNRAINNYIKKRKIYIKSSSVKKSITSSDSNIVFEQLKKNMLLSAIINNSALINGTWYKLNESVNSFKLISINRTSVILEKGSKKFLLTTNDSKQNLKFK